MPYLLRTTLCLVALLVATASPTEAKGWFTGSSKLKTTPKTERPKAPSRKRIVKNRLRLVLTLAPKKRAKAYLLTYPRSTKTPLGHSVLVVERSGGRKVTAHLVGESETDFTRENILQGGFPTEVVNADEPTQSNANTLVLAISEEQAKVVIDSIALMKAGNNGPYNYLSNSCGTACTKALRPAGLRAPFGLHTPSEVRKWFTTLGAVPSSDPRELEHVSRDGSI